MGRRYHTIVKAETSEGNQDDFLFLSRNHVVSGINPNLLLVLVGLVVDDVEEAELVDTLGGGDNAEPVTELLLLEELLGPVVRTQSADASFGISF